MSEPLSKFHKVRCGKCKNEQVVFSKTATKVTCHVCQELLAEPTGGKTKFSSRPLEALD
jgi:small subunit ribosomal protein S27e